MATEVEKMFRTRAEKILNNSILEVQNKQYRICEIEFYYFETGVHEDKYTHCDSMQLENAFFYPHRLGGKTFKAATYKCMDICYGDKNKGIYFGILIRSMRDIATNQFYTGPCVSVNALLNNYGVNEWKELNGGKDVVAFVNKEFVLKDATLKQEDIFIGPRVGLSDKYSDFKDRDYRFAINIKDIKKQKKFKQLI